MKLCREIPLEEVTNKMIADLSNFGFTLVYSEGMLKIYKERTI
jgi:hypothetical protein